MTSRKFSEQQATQAQELSEKIHPLLRGQAREVQGAVLCDLLAIWLAGHAPELRADVLAQHLLQLDRLVDVNEKIMFGPLGHPARIKGAPQ